MRKKSYNQMNFRKQPIITNSMSMFFYSRMRNNVEIKINILDLDSIRIILETN